MISAAKASHQYDNLFSSSFAATEDQVRAQMVEVTKLFEHGELDPDRYRDMLLVLAEVLNNIVEHSYNGVPDAMIDLSILAIDGGMVFKTRDLGAPVPSSLIRGAQSPDTDVPIADLPEGGFGWFIIHSLVDDIAYERTSDCNLLSLTFKTD